MSFVLFFFFVNKIYSFFQNFGGQKSENEKKKCFVGTIRMDSGVQKTVRMDSG